MKDTNSMSMSEIIANINELAAIKKSRELTKEENIFREALKRVYISNFRAGLEQQILNTKVVNKKGEDITPEKIKEVRNEHK
ncbi:hypothetical protein MCORR_v1c06240 [Mesoplasma corruscae]|uniref:Uncharacterized protein n=2 Tax=Mesoplasma corruscae TaxID=216874 RepID=A0A2S5RG64_9MOLU|nr:DUF896 domain-containing protein [Mesoplasma corruscae]PPE06319.1 hypothetical protein MCORR_v1c06240 [Mesoplasma corruscae]